MPAVMIAVREKNAAHKITVNATATRSRRIIRVHGERLSGRAKNARANLLVLSRLLCFALSHTSRAERSRRQTGIVNPNGILSGLRGGFRTHDFPGSSSSSGLSAARPFLFRARRVARAPYDSSAIGSRERREELFRFLNAPLAFAFISIGLNVRAQMTESHLRVST